MRNQRNRSRRHRNYFIKTNLKVRNVYNYNVPVSTSKKQNNKPPKTSGSTIPQQVEQTISR